MKRLLFVMIDGFGDLNFPSAGAENQFEDIFDAINAPNLSRYFLSTEDGFYGIMDPVEPGLACGSDTAHLSIFGFKPIKFYSGRGAFETIGAGISMQPGEIAFKCNFASMDVESSKVVYRRADKNFVSESIELCDFLQRELNRKGSALEKEGISVTIKHATEHRCGIKIRSSNHILSDRITGTDPLYDNLPLIKCRALSPGDKDSESTSEVVNRVSDLITSLLSEHQINEKRIREGKPPANVVLFRGCSRAPDFPRFDSFHNVDWKPLMMARTCIISGIGQSLGFTSISELNDSEFPEAESVIEKDLNLFIENIHIHADSRFAFFHIKDVDEASHEQDYHHKKALIESIDRIIGDIIERLKDEFKSDEFRIVVTGDHSTLCRIGEHSCEPVPFLVSGSLSHSNPNIYTNDKDESKLSKCFNSKSIGRFSGESVIEFMRNLIN